MALDLGITFLNTADMYGPFKNEQLVGNAIRRRRSHLEENRAAVNFQLSPKDLAELNEMMPPDSASGTRYPEAILRMVNL